MPEITPRLLSSTVAAPANSQPGGNALTPAPRHVPANGPRSDAQGQSQGNPTVQPDNQGNASNNAVKAPGSDDQAQRLEQLARRERAIQRQAQEIKAQRAQMEQERAKAAQVKVFDKNAFLSDPMSYGLTPDELSQTTLGALNQDPAALHIRQLEAKIAQLEAGQQNISKAAQDAQTAAYEQARKQISAEAKALVDSNEAAYEAIRAESAHEAITALIEQTYEADGILMSVEDAAKEVEDYLVERAMSYTRLKKIQAKISPEQAAASADLIQKKQAASTPPSQQTRTLTNSLSAQSKPLSSRERRERAMLAFQGKLT